MNAPSGPPSSPTPPPPGDFVRRCPLPECQANNRTDARYCRRCGHEFFPDTVTAGGAADDESPDLAYASAGLRTARPIRYKPHDIPLGTTRKFFTLLGWLVCLLAVAGFLIFLFVRFTASLRIAMALVSFMLIYMFVMSYVVMRKDGEGR